MRTVRLMDTLYLERYYTESEFKPSSDLVILDFDTFCVDFPVSLSSHYLILNT